MTQLENSLQPEAHDRHAIIAAVDHQGLMYHDEELDDRRRT